MDKRTQDCLVDLLLDCLDRQQISALAWADHTMNEMRCLVFCITDAHRAGGVESLSPTFEEMGIAATIATGKIERKMDQEYAAEIEAYLAGEDVDYEG